MQDYYDTYGLIKKKTSFKGAIRIIKCQELQR